MTYFHMGTPTLSSALSSFTSEFEMESGGSHSLLSPNKPAVTSTYILEEETIWNKSKKHVYTCHPDNTKRFSVIWSSLSGN